MRSTMLIAASAFALTGCGGAAIHATAKLDCPTTEGDLTRVSAAADGKSCVYKSSEGAEVTLQLVSVAGDPQTTLATVERELLAEAPKAPPTAGAAAQPESSSSAAADAARVEAEARADAGGLAHGDEGEMSLASEDAGDESDTTRVDLPGIHVVANDSDDSAQVRVGPLHVDANGDDTTIRIFREVRMRGQALSREKRGVRAMFIYTGKDLPAGYRYVGYQAGGPKTGPLTVAKVRTKTGAEAGDDIKHDVEELVRRNGGV
jgi:hypothetical protein